MFVRVYGSLWIIVDYAQRDESEGMRSERQVRRTRPKMIASCRAREWEPEAVGRGFLLSVVITFGQVLRALREFAWPLSPRGTYTILSDEDIEIGGLSDFNYCCCSQNFFFWGLYSRRLPVIETKRTLCIYVMKNMICSKQSKLDFSRVW